MIKYTFVLIALLALGMIMQTPADAAILPAYVAYPPAIDQQVTAQDLCFARWVWNDEDPNDPYWEAPFHAIGALDLRSIPQMSQAGGKPEGWGLFSYDQPMESTGMHCLGGNLDTAMTPAQINTLAIILGKQMGDFKARNMRGLIKELLTEAGDPRGQSFWKPATISKKDGFHVLLGGYGTIIDEPFSLRHPAFQPTINVRWADYRRNRVRGLPVEMLQKWTGADAVTLFGRNPTQHDLDLLLPPEYRGDGSRKPSTSISDTFTDTNGTALDSHTPTPSGGYTWTTPTNGYTINASGQIHPDADDDNTAKASTSLSSADHYSQVDVTVTSGSGRKYGGPAIRYAAAAETFYMFRIHVNDSSWANQIRKTEAGVSTVILSSTSTNYNATTVTAYLEVVGSTLDAKVDDVSLGIGGTDTAITGNLQVGLTGRATTTLEDNFMAADFAAPAARRIIRID
jgi:hypothetical protein